MHFPIRYYLILQLSSYFCSFYCAVLPSKIYTQLYKHINVILEQVSLASNQFYASDLNLTYQPANIARLSLTLTERTARHIHWFTWHSRCCTSFTFLFLIRNAFLYFTWNSTIYLLLILINWSHEILNFFLFFAIILFSMQRKSSSFV